jgi:hypothetical protein
MGTTIRNKAKEDKSLLTVDPNMRDYSKDPFIVKKVERARAFIAKHGLPENKPARKPRKAKKS